MMSKPVTVHIGMTAFELNLDGLPGDEEQFIEYAKALDDVRLEALRNGLTQAFDALVPPGADPPKLSEADTVKVGRYARQVRVVKAEAATRERNKAMAEAQEGVEKQQRALAKLRDDVHDKRPKTRNQPDGDPDGDDGDGDEGDAGDDDAVTAAASRFAGAIEAMVQKMTPAADVIVRGGDINRHLRGVNLAEVGRRAPDPGLPRLEPVLVAASGLPGTAPGGRISGMNELVTLMGARARMMPITHGQPNYVPVATLQREHRYRLSLDSTPDEVSDVLTAAADPVALTAAGGWCAPSEISYDFYSIVCEDGLLDLPTVGVLNRGGFRFPTSPSIADILAQTPSPLWSWTETQDIAAATGTGQSGTKTCARVICPGFNEVRAICDGLCVTAGNLIDFAYPEAVAHYLRTVMAARAHVTNQRIIDQVVAASTAVSITDTTGGAAAPTLGGIELLAQHTRDRFRMCSDAIIEAVLPRWAFGAFRSDLAKRTGVDNMMSVSDNQILDWFNTRNIRVQLVADWQNTVIGHPTNNPVAWPTSVLALVYPGGTFVRGQGLQLDLGVVRDSTLNATNDFTAAWLEDCYAIARVGHGSFIATIPICTDGTTGANDLTVCTA